MSLVLPLSNRSITPYAAEPANLSNTFGWRAGEPKSAPYLGYSYQGASRSHDKSLRGLRRGLIPFAIVQCFPSTFQSRDGQYQDGRRNHNSNSEMPLRRLQPRVASLEVISPIENPLLPLQLMPACHRRTLSDSRKLTRQLRAHKGTAQQNEDIPVFE